MVQKIKKPPPPAKLEGPVAPKRRGRPRAYQPEIALGKALDLFRKDGFAATSLDDLSAATGMNRPSLYGAFGDKPNSRSEGGSSVSIKWRSTSTCPATPARAAASR